MRRTRETPPLLLWTLQICCVLMLTIVAGQGAHGQTVVGRISGTVQDANGAGVPNASIKVINTATNSEHGDCRREHSSTPGITARRAYPSRLKRRI